MKPNKTSTEGEGTISSDSTTGNQQMDTPAQERDSKNTGTSQNSENADEGKGADEDKPEGDVPDALDNSEKEGVS